MTASSISNAFRVPIQDIADLLAGRLITVLPPSWMEIGKQFALYLDQPESETVLIQAWARCEFYQMLDESKPLDILAKLINRSFEELIEIVNQRGHISLAYLRIYLLPQAIEIPANSHSQFIPLPHSLYVSDDLPVLSDRDFSRLKRQLENLEPPEPLDVQIQRELEEVEIQRKMEYLKKLDWIKTIHNLGTAKTGGNYEKGTAFEQVVQRSLASLGYELDPNARGGAGGMDVCCIKPYLLVCECKSGLSIPGNTVYELHKLGSVHLTKAIFDSAVKLIIGPGRPTDQLKKSSQEYKISIINPMTLQKLVELKAKYEGAINLFELKEYLQAGQIDDKIDEYIQKVESEIKLRSHVVQTVKNFLLNNNFKDVETNVIFGLYAGSNPPKSLSTEELKEILIELSSPLAGYLGRVKGNGGTGDRFYYLRDLPS